MEVDDGAPSADVKETVPASGLPSTATGPSADADMDTDDDEVVQECDVYLNRMFDPPDFVGDMYVLQYPLRPNYRPYGDQGVLDKVELKAKSRRLKFTYKLHQNHHYNDEDVTNKYEQRHILSSTVVANPTCSYAVAVIHQGRLTLTPVRAMNQLRPDFEDFERARTWKPPAGAASSSAPTVPTAPADVPQTGGGGSSDSGGEEDGQQGPSSAAAPSAGGDVIAGAPIRVEYVPTARGPAAVAAALNAAKGEEEPWKKLEFFDARADEAKDIYLQHIIWPAAAAAEAERDGYAPDHPKLQELQLDGDKGAFLAAMCGQSGELREKKKQEDTPKDGLTSFVLSKMPPERQVEAVVRHFSVASYAQIRKRLPPSTLRAKGGDDYLIHLLRRCAILIAGNWVLKSELANFEGDEAAARDMLLILLHKKLGVLTRAELLRWQEVFKKTTQPGARNEMVKAVCVEDRNTGDVRLKSPLDQDFIRRFPTVVQEFEQSLEEGRIKLTQGIKDKATIQGAPGTTAAQQAQAAASARIRAKLLGEVRETLTMGATTFGDLKRQLQKKNTTQAIRDEDLHAVLAMPGLEAVQVRDVWLLGRTGMEANDKFRKILLGLFRSRDSISREEIMHEYQQVYGEKCMLSDYVVRQQLREIADKMTTGEGGQTCYVLRSALGK
ncbi:unnamed protein product [Polarella glacialis]|uniref:DNA-directed RNA polymerase III subunit RPC5 n=1 Tax=Polarella glacialis TaxID=89957 RepID=A0A813FEM7_POLGL|nr:unnamed protein product [Polarella glacialis]CAE8649897.1 unnamed protein product [Polarella glacialis]